MEKLYVKEVFRLEVRDMLRPNDCICDQMTGPNAKVLHQYPDFSIYHTFPKVQISSQFFNGAFILKILKTILVCNKN